MTFSMKINNLYRDVVDFDDDKQPRLGTKFALFKMKLPADIADFSKRFNDIINEMKDEMGKKDAKDDLAEM